jgi:hypothetical protein
LKVKDSGEPRIDIQVAAQSLMFSALGGVALRVSEVPHVADLDWTFEGRGILDRADCEK